MVDALASIPSLAGGLALVFIVALSAGIAALAALFLGSAVVVVERFARVAGRPSIQVCAGGAAAGLSTVIGLELDPVGLSTATSEGLLGRLLATLTVAMLLTSFSMVSVRWLLARVDSSRFALMALALVAGVCALIGGSAGLPFWSLVFALILVGPIFWLRTLRRSKRATPVEVGLRALLVAAVAAIAIGFLPEAGREWIGFVGSATGLVIVLLFGLGLLPLATAGLVGTHGSVEWFIAVRYLVARRRQIFISAITAICVVGIAAGVWLILVVLSVMNGFEETWRQEILGHRAHFVVHTGEELVSDYEPVVARIESVAGVLGASPFLDADAMVRGEGGELYGLRLRGVDPDRVLDVTRLEQDLVAGSLDVLSDPRPSDSDAEGDPPILIGSRLASALALVLGDPLLVIAPFGGPPTPMGPSPRLMRFRVAGIFRSSFQQYDEAYAYVSLPVAQAFRRVGSVIGGVEVLTADHYRSQKVGAAVTSVLGTPFQVRDWKEYFPAFFQALKTERVMMFLLLTMIMVVAAFVIVATLIMMIMEKSSDIAILKAMGARDSVIERIFALEGTLIGLLGTFLGVVAALAVTHRISWIQDRIESLTGVDALPETVYQFSTLPSRVDSVQVLIVIGMSLVLSLGATLLPSRQGAGLDPAEGLRHE